MDRKRVTALNGIVLLLLGLALIAIPVLAQPDVPDNRVEFYVEGDGSDYQDQTNLVYSDLNENERTG